MPADTEKVHRGQTNHEVVEHLAMHEACYPPKGNSIELLINGRGHALKDNETHILKINVERLIPVDAMYVRRLLASNVNIEEISENIRAKEGEAVYTKAATECVRDS